MTAAEQAAILWLEREIHLAHCRYAEAIDDRRWHLLDTVFDVDATADFGGVYNPLGRTAIVDVITAILVPCGSTQHLLGNLRVATESDGWVTSRCYVRAAHAEPGSNSKDYFWSMGEYEGHWRESAVGWRAHRWSMRIQFNTGNMGILGAIDHD